MQEKTSVSKARRKKTAPDSSFSSEEMSRYLISTVKEVIEVSRRPVPVLDKTARRRGLSNISRQQC